MLIIKKATTYFWKYLLIGAFYLFLNTTLTYACPTINGLIDYNCDGILKIAITGDSVVKGVGDSDFNGVDSGYVSRLEAAFPKVKFENLGIPGITTANLLRAYKNRLTSETDNVTKRKVANVDLFIIDVGRNDYWLDENPSVSARNIKRLASYLRSYGEITYGVAPFVTIATLLPTPRKFQEPFIAKLNSNLLHLNLSGSPIFIFFNKLSSDLIGFGGIHPDSHGYDVIANLVKKSLKSPIKKAMLAKRVDKDKDGVYDQFETNKFGTNPSSFDTDGDGLNDGVEIFTFHTNPLSADTDGDGIPDTLDPDTALSAQATPTATVTP